MIHTRRHARRVRLAGCSIAALLLSACATEGRHIELVPGAAALAQCAGLQGTTVPSGTFAVASGDGTISDAAVQRTAAGTEYCRVRGSIRGAQPEDPQTNFQVNLPVRWNLKTVQFGGSGVNGVVVEASGAFRGGGGAVISALDRGYVTYGSDSGNVTPKGVSYRDVPVAFANFSHLGVKRSKDLVSHLVLRHYGAKARLNYHIGASKGGQEALQAAQRYSDDFDGAVSFYPAAQQQSLQIGWNRLWHFAWNTPGAVMNTAKQTLLKRAVLSACDALDGAPDGLVSDLAACQKSFRVASLRCPNGQEAGDTCLSDVQIAALNSAATPFHFSFPMPNGVTSVGPWPVYVGGETATWLGNGSPGTQGGFYRHAAVRPEALVSTGIDYDQWKINVERLANVFDASNPDLDSFARKGGKLIIIQGTTDMLVPEAMTTHYVKAVQQRYGAAAMRDFLRYYVVPGYGHGSGDFVVEYDVLDAIDGWVAAGAAPQNPVITDGSAAGRRRTRPLCEYPLWPKYQGRGDLDRADSFICSR